MLGLIISVALASLLVITAAGALIRGELDLAGAAGGRTLKRGDPWFWVVTLLALGGGLTIATASVAAFVDAEQQGPAEPRRLERDGFTITVPASWQEMSGFSEALGPGAEHMLGLAGEGSELVVMFPTPAPAPPSAQAAAALTEIADELRDPALIYERWEARTHPGGVVVDARYASPRGTVVARHWLTRDDGTTRVATATCSNEGDMSDCEHVVGSFALMDLARSDGSARPPAGDP